MSADPAHLLLLAKNFAKNFLRALLLPACFTMSGANQFSGSVTFFFSMDPYPRIRALKVHLHHFSMMKSHKEVTKTVP